MRVSSGEVLRTSGRHGELVLRNRDGHLEIISNGVLLMDTRNGESERLLVRAALAARPGARTVLIGGLGVGFSLADIDNGPGWTVGDTNAPLYEQAGLQGLRRHLRDGGVLSVWSAERCEPFEERLQRIFGEVSITEVEVPPGVPDVVYVATG